jgi:hypothetical protein
MRLIDGEALEAALKELSDGWTLYEPVALTDARRIVYDAPGVCCGECANTSCPEYGQDEEYGCAGFTRKVTP